MSGPRWLVPELGAISGEALPPQAAQARRECARGRGLEEEKGEERGGRTRARSVRAHTPRTHAQSSESRGNWSLLRPLAAFFSGAGQA